MEFWEGGKGRRNGRMWLGGGRREGPFGPFSSAARHEQGPGFGVFQSECQMEMISRCIYSVSAVREKEGGGEGRGERYEEEERENGYSPASLLTRSFRCQSWPVESSAGTRRGQKDASYIG